MRALPSALRSTSFRRSRCRGQTGRYPPPPPPTSRPPLPTPAQRALAEQGVVVSVGELLRFFYGQFVHSDENDQLSIVMQTEEELVRDAAAAASRSALAPRQ